MDILKAYSRLNMVIFSYVSRIIKINEIIA